MTGRTGLGHVVEGRDDDRLRDAQARRAHRLAEELAVLGALDDVDRRPDQLDAEVLEIPSRERDGEVQRRLPAHRRQQRVGPLALEHAATPSRSSGSRYVRSANPGRS
jgi:hypothetical protein